MDVAFVYIIVAIGLTLVTAMGLREKRKPGDGSLTFRYQRIIVLAMGACAILWFLGSLTIPLVTFMHDGKLEITPLSSISYIIINLVIISCYVYGYFYSSSYSILITDMLVINTLSSTNCINYSQIIKSDVIQGKDTTRMRLYLKDGRKIAISGLLVESNIAFQEITKRLIAIGTCSIRSRDYIGHWRIVQ